MKAEDDVVWHLNSARRAWFVTVAGKPYALFLAGPYYSARYRDGDQWRHLQFVVSKEDGLDLFKEREQMHKISLPPPQG